MLIMHNFFMPLHKIMAAMIMEMVKVLLKHKDPDIKVRKGQRSGIDTIKHHTCLEKSMQQVLAKQIALNICDNF